MYVGLINAFIKQRFIIFNIVYQMVRVRLKQL